MPIEREVDHHDCVLLDDADQHDDANEGVEAQIHVEDQERQQRTQAGGGQTGKDGQGVHEALVENAENQIDHQDGDQQEDTQPLQGRLEGLRRSLQARVQRYRQAQVPFQRLDAVDRLAERDARQEVEGNGHRWQLPLVIDSQRLRLATDTGDRVERHQLAGGTTNVKTRKHRRIGLILGSNFENHLVLVGRPVDR